MQLLDKIPAKYSFKSAILLTSLLIGLVVAIGVVTEKPVPAWWFAFVPVLIRLLK